MKKRLFEKIFEEICKEKVYKLNFYSEGWLMRIKKKNKILDVVGYNFPLNSITAYQICLDKYITATILRLNKIRTVDYFLIHNDVKRKYLNMGGNLGKDLKNIFENKINKISFPIVIKPCAGTGGKNVFLCKNLKEAIEKSVEILKTEDVVVSEFIDSQYEFRFIVLDGKVELAYKKVRDGDWKHNLSTGAKPDVLDKKEILKFQSMVKKTIKSLNLKIGAIDFLIKNNKPIILEINSGVAMDHFGSMSKVNYKIAKKIYKKILEKSFGKV